MPRLQARLSDYERDSLLLAIAAMLVDSFVKSWRSDARTYVETLAAEVKSREESRG